MGRLARQGLLRVGLDLPALQFHLHEQLRAVHVAGHTGDLLDRVLRGHERVVHSLHLGAAARAEELGAGDSVDERRGVHCPLRVCPRLRHGPDVLSHRMDRRTCRIRDLPVVCESADERWCVRGINSLLLNFEKT